MERHPGHAVRMSDIAKAAGISRQALYLHFPARADLLIGTTHYVDEMLDVDARLEPVLNAENGIQQLDALIAFWGDHVPRIYGVARALMSMRETDAAAASAWDERMAAVREGCRSAIEALARDNDLSDDWTIETATDLLWAMLSVRNWELLTGECGWSADDYVDRLQRQARLTFLKSKA